MKLILGAVIATASVIIVGVLIVAPSFFEKEKPPSVMLTFNIHDGSDVDIWCRNLSDFLKSESSFGTIFISGEVAQKNPSCVKSFSKKFDIGSQTYSYVSLPQIQDYGIQLQEVKKGRDTINEIGNVDSKLFKAPFGDTDENIYSLLSSNDILADFSYSTQYNKYLNDKFLKFDLMTINSKDISTNTLQSIKSSTIPVQIEFDSSMTLEEIKTIFLKIKSSNVDFVTASDITQMDLTRWN